MTKNIFFSCRGLRMIIRWLFINVVTIILIFSWSIYHGYESNVILVAKLLAQGAFILFLINVNMYFVFLIIRKSKSRNVKVRLAKISKQMMKYHIPIALTALVIVLFHGMLMLSVKIEVFQSPVFISGIFAFLLLIILLFSGWLRRRKATGKRRKFHFFMAFIFFAFVLLHIVL